ncbi:MAG TPA: glycosyltransferase family 9 protein [Candidatus Nanoarchaeia archaeon]|nr:glycosyltransferase family 9 protein [Candidatus Nanoarchaeia archaeon]
MIGPDTMRKVDYWAGIPICFVLTAWYGLQRLLGLKSPKYGEKAKNILFVELAEMGSTVLAYPAIKKAKSMYPNSNVYFVLFKHIKESMDIVNAIPKENVITIEVSSVFTLIRDTVKFIYICRQRKIDTVINLEMFARYSTILGYLSGARKRVGFYRYSMEGLYIGNFLTHRVIYNPHIHTAHSFIALVNSLQSPLNEVPMAKFSVLNEKLEVPKISLNKKSKENIWNKLKEINPDISEKKKLILVNPNASKLIAIRKWPLENYAKLVKKLIADEDVYVALIGVANEKPDAEFIINYVKSKRVIDMTGSTNLRELIDLFNIGSVLVTNDSGPAHFASLTNIHIIVFFGPETPELYKPMSDNVTVMYSNFACSPCVSAYNQRLSPCNNNLCLKVIDVERAYGAVKRIMNK